MPINPVKSILCVEFTGFQNNHYFSLGWKRSQVQILSLRPNKTQQYQGFQGFSLEAFFCIFGVLTAT